jgi:hypothetical protein
MANGHTLKITDFGLVDKKTTSVHADLWSVCRMANLKPSNCDNAELARVIVMCLFRFKNKVILDVLTS